MPKISPFSLVDAAAELADDVEVGPFCHVGPAVRLGGGCKLLSHVSISGPCQIGRDNIFCPNVVIGGAPQDRKYKGAVTQLEIGDNNLFREAVTIHRGTEKGGGITRVGSHNMLMVNAHLGHDVQFGSHCTIANNCMIAGHVIVNDHVNMAGGVGIHHFVTVGEYAFIGGYSRIHHDVPPFLKIDGADEFRGVNTVGLQRSGVAQGDIDALQEVCRQLYSRQRPFAAVLNELNALDGLNPLVRRLMEFIRLRDQGRHGRYLEGKRV